MNVFLFRYSKSFKHESWWNRWDEHSIWCDSVSVLNTIIQRKAHVIDKNDRWWNWWFLIGTRQWYLDFLFMINCLVFCKTLKATTCNSAVLETCLQFCLHFGKIRLVCLFRFCTSIVTQDVNGQIWHSRNLDYSFVDMLRNITIRVDFIKNNQVKLLAYIFDWVTMLTLEF